MSSLHESSDWRAMLRGHRTLRGLTQAELARKAGYSLVSIKAYESGRRRPSATTLESIIGALGISREDANRLLLSAGYAPGFGSILHAEFEPPSQVELEEEAESCPWPSLITTQNFDVRFANRAFQRVLDVDLDTEYLGFGERNLLSQLTREPFAKRLQNWDEIIAFMAAVAKGDPRWRSHDVERPPPWLREPLRWALHGEPDLVGRFVELWNSAPVVPRRARRRYRVRWLFQDEIALSFLCSATAVNPLDELHLHEWIPADGATGRHSDTWL